MKIAHMPSADFGTVPIIERRISKDAPNPTYTNTEKLCAKPITALDKQISGTHYKNLAIQPIEYIQANNIPYMEGNVIKYVTRWRAKAGVQDLQKAIHYLQMLIEFETKNV